MLQQANYKDRRKIIHCSHETQAARWNVVYTFTQLPQPPANCLIRHNLLKPNILICSSIRFNVFIHISLDEQIVKLDQTFQSCIIIYVSYNKHILRRAFTFILLFQEEQFRFFLYLAGITCDFSKQFGIDIINYQISTTIGTKVVH